MIKEYTTVQQTDSDSKNSWKFDEYQEDNFQELIQQDGVKIDDLNQILELRNIKNYTEVFANFGHTMLNNGSQSPIQIHRDFSNSLEEYVKKYYKARDENDERGEVEAIEKQLFCQTILRILDNYPENGREICLRVNTIFKNRHRVIEDKVSITFDDQYKDNAKNCTMLYEDMKSIVHRFPEVVGEYLPVLEATGEYDAVLNLIKKKPAFALKMVSLFTLSGNTLSLDTIKDLLKIYSEIPSGISDLGNTDMDNQLVLEGMTTRVSRSNKPEVVRYHLLENSLLVQRLIGMIPKDSAVFEIGRGVEGHASVILDSRDSRYLLIRIIPVPRDELVLSEITGKADTHIDFESYQLFLHKSGIIESGDRKDLSERGYLLIDCSKIRENDLVEAIFNKLTGEIKIDDICDYCGFTEYVLNS